MKLHGTNPNFEFFYIGLYISMGGVFLPMHFELYTRTSFFACFQQKCDICVYKNKRRSFVHKCNKHEEKVALMYFEELSSKIFFCMLFEELSFSCFSTRTRALLSCFPKSTQKLSKCLPWSSLFVFSNKSSCVVFSELSCVHVYAYALYAHIVACLLDYFCFFLLSYYIMFSWS